MHFFGSSACRSFLFGRHCRLPPPLAPMDFSFRRRCRLPPCLAPMLFLSGGAAGCSRALLPYLFSLPAALQVAPAPCFHASPCVHVFPCSAAPRGSSPTPPWTGVTGVTTWKDSRAGWGCRKSVFFSFRAALQVDPAPCSHGLSFPGSAPSLSARLPPYPCSRYHSDSGSQKGKRKDRTPESLTSPKSSDSPNQ